MTYELRKVEDDLVHTLDGSGVRVVISRIKETRTFKDIEEDFFSVRVDLMDNLTADDEEPIALFQGSANAVRTHLMWFIMGRYNISPEHASYIGYELLRAEQSSCYVQ